MTPRDQNNIVQRAAGIFNRENTDLTRAWDTSFVERTSIYADTPNAQGLDDEEKAPFLARAERELIAEGAIIRDQE